MNINNFEALDKVIKDNKILEKYKLDKIGVFGSFARGEASNDIDFYIEKTIATDKLINLKSDLEKISEKNIDIMLKQYANPIILHRAKKDMKYVV
ncbi:MAG: nucleotidyltransferase domain-containing protein [Elusimicrobiota bacterium]|nr:nucleotidyltransferase domain-containing protein [Elusimicrobiota bacterium]